MLKLTHSTKSTKAADVTQGWHLVDVGGKVLGRQATRISQLLQGSHKATYSDNIDSGDYVVVINAKDVRLTGKKMDTKIYQNYSGYPGGRRVRTASQVAATRPTEMVKHAVSGMLPKNKLRAQRLTRLYIFEGPEHTYVDKFATKS